MYGQMRCPWCLEDAEIIREQKMFTMSIVMLSCGHQTAAQPQGGHVKREDTQVLADLKTCMACSETHATWVQGALSNFCNACKTKFDLTTQRDATEFMARLASPLRQGATQMALVAPATRVTNVEVAKVHPKVQLAITRSMVEYGRLVDSEDVLVQPTTYMIAKSGLFEVRHSDVADIITKPKEVLGVSEDLAEGVRLNLPRVPFSMLKDTVGFFRAVCEKAKAASEAYVQVWWNTQEKKYHMHVPKQNVSGGSVQHQGDFDQDCARTTEGEAIWIHVMDIHSHGSMGAFWSSIDDNDERKAPEGRLFGVIGKVVQPMPEWRWRIRTKDGFLDLDVSNLFEFKGLKDVRFDVAWKTIMETWKTGGTNGMLTLLCPVDPFIDAKCPQEWLDAVTTSSYTSGWQGQVRHHHVGGQGNPNVGNQPMLIYVVTGTRLEEFEDLPNMTLRKTGLAVELKGAN